LLKIVKAHPKVVWVAAAGNDKRVFDVNGGGIVPLPCAINEPNVYCIRAEEKNSEGQTVMADYSNRLVGKKEFLTAPGTNITSSGVVDRCHTKQMFDVLDLTRPMELGREKLLAALEECLRSNGQVNELSGTSFAVPHALSKIAR
jgi:hypothetical protein